jgi:hypothetical protein
MTKGNDMDDKHVPEAAEQQPTLATIRSHGNPTRALWFGASAGAGRDQPTEPVGLPCSIRPAAGGWIVQVEGLRPWLVTSRSRVWLVPLRDTGQPDGEQQPRDEHVLNPSPVPLRLELPTALTYRHLSTALSIAAKTANDAAAEAGMREQYEDERALSAVRDSLRRASIEALVPRGGTRTPRCRRCASECVHCSGEAAL